MTMTPKLKHYVVTVGLGFGLTYQMHFWAEDDAHAKEQAEDALVDLDNEWVEKVEEAEPMIVFNPWLACVE